jgi:ribonuclease HI
MYFDGCSKGNPGPGGAGAVIYAKEGEGEGEKEEEKEMVALTEWVGVNVTNNYAEYSGLRAGLRSALELGIKELVVCGDSLLVVKQISGQYKVKSPNLLQIYEECKELSKCFEQIEFRHVYRDNNKRADKLSNDALKLGPVSSDIV